MCHALKEAGMYSPILGQKINLFVRQCVIYVFGIHPDYHNSRDDEIHGA